ncbi:MAG: hypothetical protein SAMD01599839_08750 [Rectinema sp.]
MKVGFIGLGITGQPMTKDLIKARYSLVVSAVVAAMFAELAALGAVAAGNAGICRKRSMSRSLCCPIRLT